jgi:hypothetical protein
MCVYVHACTWLSLRVCMCVCVCVRVCVYVCVIAPVSEYAVYMLISAGSGPADDRGPHS